MKKLNEFYKDSPTKKKTRAAIIEASAELFSELGIDAVPMVRIADSCGITPRNLYRYYSNKELLAVDVAYSVMSNNDMVDNIKFNDNSTGYEQVKQLIESIYVEKKEMPFDINMTKIIMYFDLYISKMDEHSEAFVLYTGKYVKELNRQIKTQFTMALEKGIRDGSIRIKKDEVDFYEEYILQSMISIAFRAMIKEHENKAINHSLVTKQVEVILEHIRA